ncbi:hypothetical protein [Polymorphospora sp. NPDC050346]|uniref:hypothetical protein n=1 Tax=Polymorphospora sp. NPDC050346 TaxID=3155780 RepID=UPI0033DE346D
MHPNASESVEYGCAACRRPLQRHTSNGHTEYVHSAAFDESHRAQPVPLADLDKVEMVCDFCGAAGPKWSYDFGPIQIVVTGDEATYAHNIGGRWAACSPCANDVDRGDRRAITRRAAARTRRRHGAGADAADAFSHLHRALFDRRPVPRRQPLKYADAAKPQSQAAEAPPTADEHRTPRPTTLPKVRDRLVHYWRNGAKADLMQSLATGEAHHLPAHLVPDLPIGASVEVNGATMSVVSAYTRLMADHAEGGPIYWIDPDFTTETRSAAAELPQQPILADEVPTPEGILFWATPVFEMTDPTTGRLCPVIAAQWGQTPDGTWMVFFTYPEFLAPPMDERRLQSMRENIGWLAPITAGVGITYGQTPHLNSVIQNFVNALLATWILIGQPDGEVIDTPADKPIRKAYARAGRPDPTVRFVRLRPIRANESAGSGPGKARKYERRWWVAGFWRNQRVGPGLQQRRRTWVRRHIRGPKDAPFVPTGRVRVLGNPTEKPLT